MKLLTDFVQEYKSQIDLAKHDWFVTGSHAYGTPHDKSDLDLVFKDIPGLRTDLGAAGFLSTDFEVAYDDIACFYDTNKRYNIILIPPREYVSWQQALTVCVDISNYYGVPLTRGQAVQIHTAILTTARDLSSKHEALLEELPTGETS